MQTILSLAKPAPATAPPQPITEAPFIKKGPTLREHRLMIKRDGFPLTTSVIAIRDGINKALNVTLIQHVKYNSTNNPMFITTDIVQVISLNRKISQFLHLIPAVPTVHLGLPFAKFHVHSIPISYSLANIGW
jgi:hypothetical protein